MWLAEQKLKTADMELKTMSQSVEIASARMQLFKLQILDAKKRDAADAKQAYLTLKSELEGKLGQSLSGKAIDDVTFEIKELETEGEK